MPIAMQQKYESLSAELKKNLELYLDFLVEQMRRQEVHQEAEEKPFRKTGVLKGRIWMADDFDETPECFKEYM